MCNCNNPVATSFSNPTTTIPYLILAAMGVTALALIGTAVGTKKRPAYVAARKDFDLRRTLRVGKPIKTRS
jgi:hypothetical protein